MVIRYKMTRYQVTRYTAALGIVTRRLVTDR
jgi:hypothetical protein